MQSILQWPVRNSLSLFVGIDTKSIEQLSERRWIDYISLNHQIPAADAQAIFRPAALQTCVNGGRRFAITADGLVAQVHFGHWHLSIVIEIDVHRMRGRMGTVFRVTLTQSSRKVAKGRVILSQRLY